MREMSKYQTLTTNHTPGPKIRNVNIPIQGKVKHQYTAHLSMLVSPLLELIVYRKASLITLMKHLPNIVQGCQFDNSALMD
jgi:hypothetical protein